MEEFILYNFQAGSLLVLSALVYHFFLRDEVNFIQNRKFLITAVLLSLLIPLLSFNISIPQLGESQYYTVIDSAKVQTRTAFNSVIGFVTSFYLGLTLLFFIRFVVSYAKVIRKNSKFSFEKVGRFQIAFDDTDTNSYSFFNKIIIGTKNISDDDKKMILHHESCHSSHLHSADVLLMELLRVVQFFNPAVYLLEKYMKENHEFTADYYANQKQDDTEYIQLLIKSNLGVALIPTSAFSNKVCTLRRLKMLNGLNNSKHQRLHYIAAISAMIIFLMMGITLFSVNVKNNDFATVEQFETINVEIEPCDEKMNFMEEIALLKSKSIEITSHIAKNVQYPKKAQKAGIEAKVILTAEITAEGEVESIEVESITDIQENLLVDNYGFAEAAITAIKTMKIEPSFDKNNNPVKTTVSVPVTFKLA